MRLNEDGGGDSGSGDKGDGRDECVCGTIDSLLDTNLRAAGNSLANSTCKLSISF